MGYTKELSSLDKKSVLLAGGKGASLGEMISAGISVPPGFVILSTAFERFLKETRLIVEIDAALDKVNHEEVHTVEKASESIKALIMNADMSKDIKEEIEKEFKVLGADFVAVRSSATAEDSATAAWAGQLESYLNTTSKTLLDNVKKCWASLYTPRAIFYRFEKKLHKDKVSVAVVVQKMVQSEESGIAFSVHPVTQDYNQLIIEAGFGLGEAIVSGQITPDSYVVRKKELEIEEKIVNEQERMLVKKKDGGIELVDVLQPTKQVLTDTEIIELSKLIIKIEEHYSFPVDIEWARDKRKFYIVQSRPITTLTSKPAVQRANLYNKVFSRDFCLAHLEIWYRGESTNPKIWTDKKQPFLPYIVFERRDGTVNSYYDMKGFKWIKELLVKTAKKNKRFIKLLEETVCREVKKIKPIYEKRKTLKWNNLVVFLADFEEMFPWLEAMFLFCEMSKEEVKGLDITNIRNLREELGDLSVGVDEVIRKSLEEIYPDKKEYSEVMTVAEILADKILPVPKLKQRNEKYYFTGNKLFTGVDKEFIEKKFRIRFEKTDAPDSLKELKGQRAYPGIVRGKVRRVMGRKQIPTLKKGEILVSPMTMPDFLPAIRNAAAIVTDEGGITCHAAIVARELHKPCIVGTKIATQVFKDGDIIEVDANKGIVRKIN
ncbi:MAG: hypothetical protein KJ583_05240 [Nanoarchaeota archaeon]|nr:hypothetical protein [Nanoarchaeota archaeon]MBU1269574.1 hypothetical protein [Nanoarchaeota archaeon]MBU1604694.1 hypothetical protein [Nanoarchaeota archaeon]MBU2443835.1 hypothetical protein [Nanoarchaeota archaeon]